METPVAYRIPILIGPYQVIASVKQFKNKILEENKLLGLPAHRLSSMETPTQIRFRCSWGVPRKDMTPCYWQFSYDKC